MGWRYRRAGCIAAFVAAAGVACTSTTDDDVAAHSSELNNVNPPKLESLDLRCKLISNSFLDDPTPNSTHFRANVRGTDLGIPVAHGDTMYFFFGDTSGYQGIWPLAVESLPDAVGYAPLAAVQASPNALCDSLRFIVGPQEGSIGHSIDQRIEADFAFAWMRPPVGRPISDFIKNPVGPRGANVFPYAPGDFEVPSGAFSYNGSIYIFYTTVGAPDDMHMKGSYLVRWNAPAPTTFPEYDILYGIDQRFNNGGPLRGDFINIAPVVVGDWVYMFGTGEYRNSSIHLARKRLSTLSVPGQIERYDAKTRNWKKWGLTTGDPIVKSTSAGEISVRHFPGIDRYVMLSQEFVGDENVILARFAKQPEGPWTAGTKVASMSTPGFRGKYCCIDNDCSGDRLMHCDRAGFYATYMLPDLKQGEDGRFTIDFLVSTWDPYNVALMSATFSDNVLDNAVLHD